MTDAPFPSRSPVMLRFLRHVTVSTAMVCSAACGATNAATAPVTGTVPGAPDILGLTAGNMMATLTFRAPANTGSSAITSYRATCRSSAPQVTANASASPMLIVGLLNGVTYTCTLAAINSAGPSSESEAVTVTPVGPLLSVSPH